MKVQLCVSQFLNNALRQYLMLQCLNVAVEGENAPDVARGKWCCSTLATGGYFLVHGVNV